MSPLDLVYYVFWYGLALLIVGVFVVPIAGMLITIIITGYAILIGCALAVVGYLIGIPWAIYHRIVDGEWPDGG